MVFLKQIKLKKILITGGAGFFGSHITENFLGNGYKVNVIDDFSTGNIENLKKFKNIKRLSIFKGSIGDKKKLLKALKGCEGVIHCATRNVRFSINNPIKTHEVNSKNTLQLLEQARKLNIKKFIYCSSSEVYGNCNFKSKKLKEDEYFNPTSIYGATKLAGEYYAKVYKNLYKLNLIIIRPFNLYGERAHMKGDSAEVISRFFLNLMQNKDVFIFGNGNYSRDFTYVKDAAMIFYKIFTSKNKFKTDIINLGFGKSYTVNKIFLNISKIVKNKTLKPIFIKERPGDVRKLICDNSKIKNVFGVKPSTKFYDGLKKYYKWIKDKKKLPYIKAINW